MPYPDKFTSFQQGFEEVKPFGDRDIDIQIEAYGICASGLHTINGDWGRDVYPLAVGHEIIGKAIRVGPQAMTIKEGQRIGVGAQIWSCLECRQCKNNNEKDWAELHSMSFDLIVHTANSFEGFELSQYLGMLDVQGRWVSAGLPPSDVSFQVKNADFVPNACLISASHIGSRRKTLEMLQLAAEKGIKTWVEEVPISAESLSKSFQRLQKHDVRYRFCLTEFGKEFGQ